jgi:hypothetical protein
MKYLQGTSITRIIEYPSPSANNSRWHLKCTNGKICAPYPKSNTSHGFVISSSNGKDFRW